MGTSGINSLNQSREPLGPDRWSAGFNRESSCPAIVILVVCSSKAGLLQLGAALSDLPCELIDAKSRSQAREILASRAIDLVIIDLAVAPSAAAFELCQSLKEDEETQFLPLFVIGSSEEEEAEIGALEAGADGFLTKPLRPKALQTQIQAALRHKRRIDSLDESEAVLFSLAQSVENRDPDLGEHCHRLALTAAAMGAAVGLSRKEISTLQRGGFLHDIGKVAVPDKVLFKPGPLTTDEWETMKTHTVRGERICSGMRSMASVLPIIRSHHERWDGTGYPDGLAGEEIPLLARILQIADIFDALTTARPYKPALLPAQALATLQEEAHRGWRDPNLVNVFSELSPTLQGTFMMPEHSHLSLHALASSVDRFRNVPSHSMRNSQVTGALHSTPQQDLKLVSGF